MGLRGFPRNRSGPVAFVLQSASQDAHHRNGAIMSQGFSGNRRPSPRAANALIFAAAMIFASAIGTSHASAQALGYGPAASPNLFTTEDGSLVAPPRPGMTEPGD